VARKYATRVVGMRATLSPDWSRGARVAQKNGGTNRLGVHPTASPSAYACDAATAFLAAISLALWRISSAKRGI
jgi:hypothetical protein